MSCAAGLGLDGQLSSPSLFLWPSAERAWVGAPPREMKKKPGQEMEGVQTQGRSHVGAFPAAG